MTTMTVKDSAGSDVTIEKPNSNGRVAAASSRPVALSTEDLAALTALATAIGEVQASPTSNTLLDRLKTIATAAAAATPAGTNTIGAVVTPGPVTITVSITRPADTTAYAAGDALSDSTSAPTANGFLITGAARGSGKTVILSDVIVTSSAPTATALQGEIVIFDTAVTAINDNAAWAVSDSEIQTVVDIVPFALFAAGNNARGKAISGAEITTVGSANLRFLVRVTNAYVPISGEVLTFRFKFQSVD